MSGHARSPPGWGRRSTGEPVDSPREAPGWGSRGRFGLQCYGTLDEGADPRKRARYARRYVRGRTGTGL
ncbi:hypothetical protein SLNWT_5635 [Streptomyces albus]|uniref:Uncharacterized protein n=1 Tax=Streptomyces albus (strain ATCC 21838 / DSM 41398 / FERM P-419 / JCM 4703 / NBRC 107858) TaxID=1081613 RepID=A0A0B5F555_STRA4|nr:hypothetical protein SLNWT_5635 [Streptomyces albus]AOU80313.1 hypothetical protein SLNHY_5622 [Streptomyces albus]AYN36022.1 hypothetical protein DUI70_5529 [Streptomyces albus]